MKERLCFVQFLHPGGEHGADQGALKQWNRGDHKRKFIRGPGRLIDLAEKLQDTEIAFWGEWEPPSHVAQLADVVPYGPRFIHDPFLPPRAPRDWCQNTDPFVFGDTFHYTGCLQHTKFGPTQLRFLARGSVILFGSCVERSRFVLDTVLVVDRYIDHSRINVGETRRQVSPVYATATLDPWYSGKVPAEQSHRLYFGATQEACLDGMFSFFPARAATDSPQGFPRPTIDLPEAITPTMCQGKRLNPQSSIGDVRRLWERVVEQVRQQDLALGTWAEEPRRERLVDETARGATRLGY
jgi:hypothetical protein